jgi:hypothetical protein
MNSTKTDKKVDLTQLCEILAPIVRMTMVKYFASNCCVATCKILRDVFGHYGYRARQVPVTVTIINRAMRELVEQNVTFPKEERARLAFFERHGAWGIGIVPVLNSKNVNGSGFGGHLVLNVDGILVDASLQQAERRDRQIILPPWLAITPVPAGFFAARAKGQQIRGVIGDCLICYRRLENEAYRISPNWRQESAGCPAAFREILTRSSQALGWG